MTDTDTKLDLIARTVAENASAIKDVNSKLDSVLGKMMVLNSHDTRLDSAEDRLRVIDTHLGIDSRQAARK